MPQCPHCQTSYDKGQRYCSVCGSFLLHPEERDTFCPQCGVRVSPRQEFCHECDAPLKGEGLKAVPVAKAEAPPAGPAPEAPPAAAASGMPTWIIGSLVAAGVIIILLQILLFSRSGPPPTPKAEAPAAPALTAETPAALKDELQKVLSTLRDAQLKKDITEFMGVYSAEFPGADQKRKDVLETWQNFDYANLVFTVDKVQEIDANNALAWVTWYMDIRNRNSKELSSATQAFQVRFSKEGGNWRIRELKEVQ